MVYSGWVLNFYLFSLSKIFEDGVFLGSADGKVFLYVFVFGDIMLFGSVYALILRAGFAF